ncbi:MAG: hypothetical protein WBF40_08380, partial [Methyloceanibacter sp.]
GLAAATGFFGGVSFSGAPPGSVDAELGGGADVAPGGKVPSGGNSGKSGGNSGKTACDSVNPLAPYP